MCSNIKSLQSWQANGGQVWTFKNQFKKYRRTEWGIQASCDKQKTNSKMAATELIHSFFNE
jgi:hypothetical protein